MKPSEWRRNERAQQRIDQATAFDQERSNGRGFLEGHFAAPDDAKYLKELGWEVTPVGFSGHYHAIDPLGRLVPKYLSSSELRSLSDAHGYDSFVAEARSKWEEEQLRRKLEMEALLSASIRDALPEDVYEEYNIKRP